MKSPPFFRHLLLASAWALALAFPAGATTILEPLWSINPASGSPVASTGDHQRGIAYNPVSRNVLVATRSTADIFVLDRNTGAILQEPEIGQDGLPTGGTVNRKLLKRPFFLPPDLQPADVVTSSGTSGALNLVGVAADGVVYACNLVVSSQTNNFRIYRWQSDGVNTAETNNPPYVAWPPAATEENPFPSGNPDVSATTSQRWGDSMTVRGAGVNTQIIVGSDAGAIAIFTTVNGIDFTPALIPGALSGAGRGLAFGAGDTFYSKSSGGTILRRSSFTLTPPPPAVTLLNSFTVPTASTNPIAVDLTTNRLAMIDVPAAAGDAGLVRLFDINPVGTQPSTLATAALAFPNVNLNGTGAVAMGDNKIFACPTNRGIQAFSIVDDNLPSAPTSTVSPLSALVWTRGLLTLTGSATGSSPLSYSWYKDGVLIPNEDKITLTINPVTPASAGLYRLRVTNNVNFAESAAVTVTTRDSTDTGALTKIWQLKPGDRPWLTTTDTERGMDVNPTTNRMYVVSRAAPGLSVQVLNSNDGSAVGTLDVTGISGGLSGITLNLLGVAADGAIYACNLTDGSTVPFRIYRWQDDGPLTPPEVVYEGNPISGRMGDCIDVRGAGANTEIVVGGRSGNYVIFKFMDSILTAYPITVPDVPASTFNLGVAFGNGNEVWGKSIGTYGTAPDILPNLLVRTAYNINDGTGTLLASTPPAQVITGSLGLAFDPVNNLIGFSASELSDNIRLYKVLDPGTGTLELLDQEFYPTDNPNINGVGAATFAGGRLYTLNTNNGIVASTVTVTVSVPGVITNLTRTGNDFSFTLSGAPNASYLIQRSPNLVDWTDDGTVVLGAGGSAPVTRTAPAGRQFFRARAM